ncbi:hypothetical protein SLA2020_004830 [Shorea laevis]
MVAQLLHGTLDVTITGINKLELGWGTYLHNEEVGPWQMGKRILDQVKKNMLCQKREFGSQLYATVDLGKTRVARTKMIKNDRKGPRWNESFHIYCAHTVSDIIFTVKDDDPVGATLIGRAYVPVEDVISGFVVNRQVSIVDERHNPILGQPKIQVRLQFFNVALDSNWSKGIQSPEFTGVPHTFFEQEGGCRVTLYQDAHVQNEFDPLITLPGGKNYEPKRCWEDIFDAISNAKYFIYITGWSVYTEITLVRDGNRPKPGGDKTFGQLLMAKAEEGVMVLMLVWDDRTSVKELKKDGLMATHDQETAEYFRGSKVHCVLCPRKPDDEERLKIYGIEVASMFTHHQKTLIVDSELGRDGSGERTIVSFIGGIDLCDGRYDFQDHPLFKTLNTVHKNDFHQPNFRGSSIQKGGPREPWHDIHCRLEGPVAWDVLQNFERRWRKQVGRTDAQYLFAVERLRAITGGGRSRSSVTEKTDVETWKVQIFRSIDSGAVSNFEVSDDEMRKLGLVRRKEDVIERSVQDAYINAIRRAKNFIYIENQYFLGSSFGWKPDPNLEEDVGALHLIPKELSLKIVSKIEAGERFAVYIVIPMWPEGIPESASVQAILDWQRRTMEMMYSDIVEALRKKGKSTDPREYLTFFCLGNRETKKPAEYAPTVPVESRSDYKRAQQARRFMIYVHAKMMIVDDEYIIIGSANINQRSMDGGRDTEIAMGGFQPHHLATTMPARGQIYGLRMSLWREHLGRIDALFQRPERVECVRRVNSIANELWEMYTKNTFDRDLHGHLLRYPIEVSSKGEVTAFRSMEFFSDTKARVLGTKPEKRSSFLNSLCAGTFKSKYLPPILTT